MYLVVFDQCIFVVAVVVVWMKEFSKCVIKIQKSEVSGSEVTSAAAVIFSSRLCQ